MVQTLSRTKKSRNNDLKWVHVARYELILTLDGAPKAQEHFKTPPDPQKDHGMINNQQKSKKSSRVGQASLSAGM